MRLFYMNVWLWQLMNIYEEFKIYAKTNISIFINLRYLRFELLKNKENNKKVCDIFHNFKNIPCYVTRDVSLKRFYFALFDDGLIYTLKTLKLAYIGFAFKLFIYCQVNLNLMFTRPQASRILILISIAKHLWILICLTPLQKCDSNFF